MYFGSEYYFLGKHKALAFFAAVPFGLAAHEYFGWHYYGGGQELWDEISGGFGLKPFIGFNSGVQMGGWFNKEINTADDFKGIKFRMPGLGGEVLRRMGAAVVTIPGGELFQALQSGVIDATEWIGPWHDLAFGFHKITKFYYWPGFHEPTSTASYVFNKTVWEELSAVQQEIFKMAFEAETLIQGAEYEARNPDSLKKLIEEHGVELRRYPEELVKQMAEYSFEVIAEIGESDPLAKKVFDSYRAYNINAIGWSRYGMQAFLNAREQYYPQG
jgi:TRAP-type mannitol/chloroaromatic compound transport system substrate-binding protein